MPSNNVWANNTPAGTEEEVTTPSGQTCLAKKMSIDSMITAGLLSESDAITASVSKYIKKVKIGQGGSKPPAITETVDEQALMRDPKAVVSLISLLDKSMPHIVTSPKVVLHYTVTKVGKTTVQKMIPLEEREEGIVYTDQIGFEDKMFIFDWAAGGLGAMLNFRQ